MSEEVPFKITEDGATHRMHNGSFATSLVRYDLRSLLLFFALIAIALTCFLYFGPLRGLLVSLFVNSLILISLRWWRAWRNLAVLHFALAGAFFGASICDIGLGGHYANRYNSRMETLALRNNLIGAGEESVREILGTPTFVTSGWTVTDARTGEPGFNSEFVTTYFYAPYPMLPFGDVFKVNCVDGRVVSIEVSDE